MKPGNAGRGKGPQFRANARRGKAQEPTSSEKCAETSDGIARQSEGNAHLSLLFAVRQAVPGGPPGPCMATGQSQWRGSRCGWTDTAMNTMREMMGRLKLTVNEEKTRLCRVPESSFDFLGYTFGRCYSAKTDRHDGGLRHRQLWCAFEDGEGW
jgi:hypothetical protein